MSWRASTTTMAHPPLKPSKESKGYHYGNARKMAASP